MAIRQLCRVWSGVLWILVGGTWLPQRTAAQSSGPNEQVSPPPAESDRSELPEGYDEMIDIAFQEYQLRNYPEARSRFLEAHRIYPNARTLRALGIVAYELRNYVSSIHYLEQALESTERPLTPRLRKETEQLLRKAHGYVARYEVLVRPPSATLLIDGSEAELSSDGTLILEVGDHVLEAVAPGHRSLKKVLRVVGGAEESVDLVLMPLPEAQVPVEPVGESPRREAPLRRKWWLWSAIGSVVAAGVVAGLVVGLREPDPRDPNLGTTGDGFRINPAWQRR